MSIYRFTRSDLRALRLELVADGISLVSRPASAFSRFVDRVPPLLLNFNITGDARSLVCERIYFSAVRSLRAPSPRVRHSRSRAIEFVLNAIYRIKVVFLYSFGLIRWRSSVKIKRARVRKIKETERDVKLCGTS